MRIVGPIQLRDLSKKKENLGKPWENPEKTPGKPRENPGKTSEISHENPGKTVEKTRKTLGKPWGNPRGGAEGEGGPMRVWDLIM